MTCVRGGVTIILFGCGGHARSIMNVIRESDTQEEILLVDEGAKSGEIILGSRVAQAYQLKESDNYIVALGNNEARMRIYQKLESERYGNCISIISAYSRIGIGVRTGIGTFIAPGAYVGPQAEIGNDSIINTGSIVEHEVRIGSHTHIAPRAVVCGRTEIGDFVFCGAGSVVIDKIRICDNVVIGAGAVVKECIEEPGIYVGVPARKISG